jgi:hypothetical protein
MKNITLISATSKQLKQVNKILQRLFKMYYLEEKMRICLVMPLETHNRFG